jgi:hypothetical protein
MVYYTPMKTIFAVFASGNPVAIKAALDREYPLDHLDVGTGQWLVIGDGTAKDVSDKLGVSDGVSGNAIIVTTSGYFGRAPNNVWEWLTAKMKATA